MNKSAVYITDIAAFLPNDPVENGEMERLLGQVGARPSRARRAVLRSNGIVKRHYAIDPETLEVNFSNASLTANAIRKLDPTKWHPDQLGCLSCGTSIPDQILPSHASMVQGELQLPPCEVSSTSGVCASGMSALKYAYMSVLSGLSDNAIAAGSELVSRLMRANNYVGEYESNVDNLKKQPEIAFEKDFLRWMLSDGAGAVLMENRPNSSGLSLRIDWLEIRSFSGEMETCMYAGATKDTNGTVKSWQDYSYRQREALSVMAIKQDVRLLNEHIIDFTVTRALQYIREKHGVFASEVDWFIPHYSSQYFRDKVLVGMKEADMNIPQERWFTNLTQKGNTGAASIYIMLEELFHSGRLKPGQTLLCYVPESGRFSTSFMHLTVV